MSPSPFIATCLLIATHRIRELLVRIQEIQDDTQMPDKEKLSEIKNIKKEIAKVNEQIDSIKKEIKLISSYRVN